MFWKSWEWKLKEYTPTKRRRGAQPGNQNAKGNRGNPCPRLNRGNRGGTGAPIGNRYALKRPRGLGALMLEYRNNREAREWLEANSDRLATVIDSEATDAVDIAVHTRITPDTIAARGREYEFGLFINPDQDSEESMAA